MTWTKLGDEFGDECWTLSDKAFRLHVEGLCWSNRMLTDGQLAKDEMRRWARHPEAAEELVDVGWWKDCGGHYLIVHHIGYQRTRKQVAKQSSANRGNANSRWSSNKSSCDSHTDSQSESDKYSQGTCDSQSDSQCRMDWTGQDGPREEGYVTNPAPPKKSNNGTDAEAEVERKWRGDWATGSRANE
jgi:hypothetical protein